MNQNVKQTISHKTFTRRVTMKRYNTLTLVFAAVFTLFAVAAIAQNGAPVNSDVPETFIDEDGDGVCDTYQAGGQGQGPGQGNGRAGNAYKNGTGAAGGTQAKTQLHLRDGSGTGNAYKSGTCAATGTGRQTRSGGAGKGGSGRGRK